MMKIVKLNEKIHASSSSGNIYASLETRRSRINIKIDCIREVSIEAFLEFLEILN